MTKRRVSAKQRLDLIKAELTKFDNKQNIDLEDYVDFIENTRDYITLPLAPKNDKQETE